MNNHNKNGMIKLLRISIEDIINNIDNFMSIFLIMNLKYNLF